MKHKHNLSFGRNASELNEAFVAFEDIMADIRPQSAIQPSNNDANNSKQNREKSNPIWPDPKQFALNSNSFAKAGEVLSNLAQPMDPIAVSEPITNSQNHTNENENTKKEDEPQSVAQEYQKRLWYILPEAESTTPTETTPLVTAASMPVNSPEEQVTIKYAIDFPAPRESSPSADWFVVDANDHIDDQRKNTGAIPKTPAVRTPGVGSAPALPNYSTLAKDLEDNLTLKSQASQTPPRMPIIHHPSKCIY